MITQVHLIRVKRVFHNLNATTEIPYIWSDLLFSFKSVLNVQQAKKTQKQTHYFPSLLYINCQIRQNN